LASSNAKLEKSGHKHPVSCVDSHDPKSMQLRVTRPGFINGIKALKAHQGITDYDPNRDATRQEMRSFVCGQCHVEYYCGPKTALFFPWINEGPAPRIRGVEPRRARQGWRGLR
jgi:formate-dependent nitrite reductase cytochrome c552 subunit